MSTITPTLASTAAVDETPALLRALRAIRDTVREKHPFERNTTLLKPHAVAWERYAKQLGRTAIFYVPAAIVVFGWPVAMKWVVNWSNGVYDAKPKRR
ncbi:hypothetical protein M409DRAFT_28713 [Zasmidium cellare ATCC 36951]|uniref:Uncharacterized protein n=1 Tax=Zasmidium cellare ATCC 36951 TaxID=1080233 RepID=A0A6A6C1T7_ZASCE|nr:uncharacterized protein M409DRAFT_28713 [Zasmidium cellare ATCC 36951]KAF2160833.1 hypothetical protein M409DRAFT_28713 [Zasmidium cellare ATCC 36951]